MNLKGEVSPAMTAEEREGITVLPDGSAFFVGIVRDKPMAYPIVLWRNYRTAIVYSRVSGPQMNRWQAFRWAFMVTPFYFGGYWK